MAASSPIGPARPQSVKELTTQAENFNFNNNIPLKHWTRAAETLYQEASFALSDGDYGRAYVMLYRHSILVLKSLPSHPQFKDPESRNAYRPLSKRINRVIRDLEQLKPVIEGTHNEWQRMQPATREQSRGQTQPASPPRTYEEFAARDPSLSGAKILDASENQELAVDLAQKELSRRESLRRATKQAGISDEETLLRRRAGRWDDWETQGLVPGDSDLQRQMQATRQTLNATRDRNNHDSQTSLSMPQTISNRYSYPSIARSRPVDYTRTSSQSSLTAAPRPDRPPKEVIQPPPRPSRMPSLDEYGTPPVPRKAPLDEYKPLVPTRPPNSTESRNPLEPAQAPALPRKERLTFKPGGYLENGDPIRSVFLPSKLRQGFLNTAADNTRAGLETCGMLCGTAINNALFIRCLLIPDQKSTPDTCETENESAMFDYCEQEDLMVIGWIHTHPTQTCFMSSRDLHTHAGYQVMMPESIAIVCAPKFTPSYGIFRLTNPPGLDHILDCTHSETFHQHSIGNLYVESEQPYGHVYESDKMPFYIHDLRSK